MLAFRGLTEFYEARGGELSPESDCSFQNWDARIHVGCTGCITQPLHSCDMLRRLREIHVQHRVAHVSTPGTYTRAAPIRCGYWTRFPMNCPSRRSTAISSTGRSRRARLVDKLVHGPDRHRGP